MKLPAIGVPGVPDWAVYAGLGAAAFLLWKIKQKGIAGAAQDIGGAVVDAAGGVAVGAVKAAGGLVGVPDTDEKRCQDALDLGDTWGASFYCPAGTFLKSIVTPKKKAPSVAAGTEPNRPYQTPEEAAKSGACTGALCGPTFEGGAASWLLPDSLVTPATNDFSTGAVGGKVTPVAGLRG